MDLVEECAAEAYEMHSALLSKGFALERPPSVNQVDDRTFLLQAKSINFPKYLFRLLKARFLSVVTLTNGISCEILYFVLLTLVVGGWRGKIIGTF